MQERPSAFRNLGDVEQEIVLIRRGKVIVVRRTAAWHYQAAPSVRMDQTSPQKAAPRRIGPRLATSPPPGVRNPEIRYAPWNRCETPPKPAGAAA
jgi:hypothetical protein